MYVLKNCNQDPYGFQNFMSSWGLWSKISNIQHVGDVYFFRSKSSLVIFTTAWKAFFAKKYQFFVFLWLFHIYYRYSVPSGSSLDLHHEARSAELRMDGQNMKRVLQISLYCVSI